MNIKKILAMVLLAVAMVGVLAPVEAMAYVAGSGDFWNGSEWICYEYGYEWNEDTFVWDFWYNQWPCF